MSRRFLALDLGAESGRAILAHLADHKLELRELHRFPNIPVQLPTGLYWDTLRLFHDMCEGIRAAGKATDSLDGIGIDTWGVDFALIAPDGALLDNPRHYRDPRTDGIPEQVFATVPKQEIFSETGIQFMPINSLYQLYAVSRTAPQTLGCAAKLLFIPDLFNYFLTGTYACERTVASTSQFYNPVTKRFATDLLRKLGINAGFFAKLTDPGIELGSLLPFLVDLSGLNQEPVVYTTGSHDTASAVAAVPASSERNWCYISSGTWSLMGVETDAPIITDASLRANFTNEVGIEGTIRFLKNIPGLWPVQECRRAWAREGEEYSYAELMERAAAAAPIDTILDLDQFTSPGNHPKRIREYCRETGQQTPEGPGAITRVIFQSIAARYANVLETLESLTGRRIEVIHIVGGGSQNKLLNQFAADMTGRRVVAGPTEATAAGNALTQALGTGDIKSLEQLRDVMRHSFDVQEYLPKRERPTATPAALRT
ncbi:MAG: rhamnulokinase [Acidobacteriaceae bacterium]|nr:rhamnulokinase [Acidobacteriaceae bacterium]